MPSRTAVKRDKTPWLMGLVSFGPYSLASPGRGADESCVHSALWDCPEVRNRRIFIGCITRFWGFPPHRGGRELVGRHIERGLCPAERKGDKASGSKKASKYTS